MNIREAFFDQARACANLGSPFMDRLMCLLARHLTDDTRLGAEVLQWQGEPSGLGDSVPLRLAGILHRLILEGRAPALAASYPPNLVDDATLWERLNEAMRTHDDRLIGWLASPPQTNEIRRSVALIPALHLIAARTGLPLRLSELGASAGLNLLNDQFRLDVPRVTYGPARSKVLLRPDWSGPAPKPCPFAVTDRAGVDLRPMDLTDPKDQLRALSYLWPDQTDRLNNTKAAISLAITNPPRVDEGDAVDWLKDRLLTQSDGECHVVYHTIAWQYFPKEAQDRGLDMLSDAGARATDRRPLAHLAMSADDSPDGAGLTLTLWPKGRTINLARVDFHGRWINWSDIADAT